MKRFLLILTCLAGIINTYGQNGQIVIEVRKDNNKSRIFTRVQVLGAFPRGDTAWRSYLEKNLNASMAIAKRAKKGKYTVVINYVVDKDGSISDILCKNDPGYGMCQEAIRVIIKSVKGLPSEVKVRSS